MNCPKCGATGLTGDECPSCGVLVSKYLAAQERKKADDEAKRLAEEHERQEAEQKQRKKEENRIAKETTKNTREVEALARDIKNRIIYRCPNCGHIGKPVVKSKGSGCLCLTLFLFFIIPGIIYFVWMLVSERKVCTNCGYDHLALVEHIDEVVNTTCPFCAESIKPQAKVCKHCGRDLPNK